MEIRPEPRDGVVPSRLQLPAGAWATVLQALCAHFPRISQETWRDRFARGRVLDATGEPLALDTPYRLGVTVFYFREVDQETVIPFTEQILHLDSDLLVVDKPHFLPVVPAGGFVRQSLLYRLKVALDNPDLAPVHRIDRGTAGLVMFSVNPATRDCYQALFRDKAIRKQYEALAPALPGVGFPCTRRTRLAPGVPFFRMREIDGPSNSESRIDVLDDTCAIWRYALEPVTGKKHQLRVHLAALGAPIVNDRFYPCLSDAAADDYSRPLKLLARALTFIDPLSGHTRIFESGLTL